MKEMEYLYNQFTTAIQQDNKKGADILMKLAKEYSRSELLQSEAALLKTELATAPDEPGIKASILHDMIDLADKIYEHSGKYFQDQEKNEKQELVRQTWWEARVPQKTIFSCEHITKRYPSSDFTLTDISLQLRSGEITGVVGENGNGKTTLLKIIGGILRPDKGKLSYGELQKNENEVEWDIIKPQIAYLSQELGRMVGSVKKSIQYTAALHGIFGNENDKEVTNIIRRLGLSKYENSNWEHLSGGYKLRFALASILVWKPKLMVLDEPLANLDINTQMRVLSDLKELSQSIKHPIAIIMSSQNIEEIESVSDNMIVLKKGVMRHYGPVNSVDETRKKNLFEFKSLLSREELEARLANFDYTGLDYNGFYFFISTSVDVTRSYFLQYCSENNIPLSYFQDISSSTKKLLIQTTLF